MPAKITFHDLTDLRHFYFEGCPEARMARYFKVDRAVIRRVIIEQGWLSRDYFASNGFLADERPAARSAYTAAATAARWRHR